MFLKPLTLIKMEELMHYWEASSSFAEPAISDKWWNYICQKYSEEGRIYHNKTYLQQLFHLYELHKEKFLCSEALILATFFHKLEYSPRSGDGEAKSLQKFKEFTEDAACAESDLSKAVCLLLEATLKNLTDAHMEPGASGSDAVHYFLDFIVAILGASQEDYKQYTTKVRAEYSHLSSQEYIKLRGKTLKYLLLIPNLYSTKEFQASLEEKARRNIQEEICQLEDSQTYM